MTRVTQERPAPVELETLLRSAPGATFFHTPAWTQSLERSFPRCEVSWLVARDEKGAIAGIMPAARLARGPFYRLQALPFGTYGDPLARDPAARTALVEAFFDRARSIRCIGAAVHSFGGTLADPVPRGAAVRAEECRLVPLAGGMEEVLARWSPKRRQLARRAERAGVAARPLDTEDEARRFHALYAAQSSAWGGVHPYPERLFIELFRRRGEGVVMYGAFLDGELLGGHVDFFHGPVAQAWQAGMSPRGNEHEAATMLLRAALADACARGMRTFNLGSSAGDRGMIFFKESLGGIEHRYPVLAMRGALERLRGGGGGR